MSSGLATSTCGQLPRSVIRIRPASPIMSLPRVTPGARRPSGKTNITWPAGMTADVGHGHDQPVGADHHAAAAGDLDHRRPHLGHQRFDVLVQVLQLGQTGGAGDIGRGLLRRGGLGIAVHGCSAVPSVRPTPGRRSAAARAFPFVGTSNSSVGTFTVSQLYNNWRPENTTAADW